MLSWTIGDVRVTQVVESKGASPPSFFFSDVGAADVQRHAWLRPHFAHGDGRLFASVHAFVVESEGRASSSTLASATTSRVPSRCGTGCAGRSSTR